MNRIRLLLALSGLFASVAAIGDRPALEREYTVYSPNGKYEFTMYPSTRDGNTFIDPHGEARKVGAAKNAPPLWTVTGWYVFQTFISDDGHNLVRMGPWASRPPAVELAVAFYRDGQEVRRYSVADLVDDLGSLPRSVSHYTWQARGKTVPGLTANGEFRLRTLEGKEFLFNVSTGQIVDTASQGDDASKLSTATSRCEDSGPGTPTMVNAKTCAEVRFELAEQRLDSKYKELHNAISDYLSNARESGNSVMEAPLTGQLQSLQDSQVHWKEYRSSTCRYAYYQYFPGSMAGLEELTCLQELTERRIEQLEAISTLQGEPINY